MAGFKLNGKRGISPLMATVLLVAFSIALGAVVMSWGEDYISTKSDFTAGANELGVGCDRASFSIISVKEVPQVCYDGSAVQIFIENGPSLELANIQARLVGTDGIAQMEILSQPLAPLDAVKTAINYDSIGFPLQLKLIPKISIGNAEIFCADKALVIDGLVEC
jgi:flagellin-like protein